MVSVSKNTKLTTDSVVNFAFFWVLVVIRNVLEVENVNLKLS